MLEKQICNTVAKYVQNSLHDIYGISCQHDICSEVSKMFIYLYVGDIDCGALVCGEKPTINFDPTEEVDDSCATITITDSDTPISCNPINIS